MQDSASRVAVFDLTDRQREIYDWIYAHARDKGYQPSYRSAAAHFKIKSPHGFGAHVAALERKGFIGMVGESRAMRFLRRPNGEPFSGFVDDPPLGPAISDSVPLGDMPAESQREIFLVIYRWARDFGYQPSIKEMMAERDVTSPHGTQGSLKRLEDKHWIRMNGTCRAVTILRRPDGLPFRGFADKEGGAR